jgi:hypothetical protein
MNFFIKKNSTLPELIFPLTQKFMDYYNITADMLDNVAVTFSMTNAETGLYAIANVPANLIIETPRPNYPSDLLYSLSFRFKLSQTKKTGNYIGEFKLDFLGNENCGKITIPDDQMINIIISDSITKTTVI